MIGRRDSRREVAQMTGYGSEDERRAADAYRPVDGEDVNSPKRSANPLRKLLDKLLRR